MRFLSETVYPRNFTELNNLNAAADYIHDHFQNAGAKVTEQSFQAEGETYRNVIARFGPENAPVIIIGAHYDSHEFTPGADDNASGVAGLLELALLLKQHPPGQVVELIAYTLEEPPFFRTELMGSAVHVRSAAQTDRPVRLMIALETIGYFDDAAGSQKYPLDALRWLYPDRGNFIAVIGRLSDIGQTRKVKALMTGATDLPVYSINAPTLIEGLDFSDHANYWNEGFNALMITDTAFFRNPHYHEPTDSAETLDYQRMTKVVQAVYSIIEGLTDDKG